MDNDVLGNDQSSIELKRGDGINSRQHDFVQRAGAMQLCYLLTLTGIVAEQNDILACEPNAVADLTFGGDALQEACRRQCCAIPMNVVA